MLLSIKHFGSSRDEVKTTMVICEIMYISLNILHSLTLMTTLSFSLDESIILSFICIRF
jgi:hypothetical protein